jgi:hypothetical protein
MAPPWQVAPSALVGLAVQPDEIGARSESTPPSPEFAMPVGVSSTKTGAAAPPSKCPTKVVCAPDTVSCQEMYGTLPENVMSAASRRSHVHTGWRS